MPPTEMSNTSSAWSAQVRAVTLAAALGLLLQSTAHGARIGGYLFDGTAGTGTPNTVAELGGDIALDLFLGGPATYNADTPFAYAGNTSLDVSENVVNPSNPNARANNDDVTAFEFQNTDTWTVSLWLKTTFGGAFQQVVGQRQQVSGNGWYVGVGGNGLAVPNAAFFFTQGQMQPDGRGAEGTTALNDGQWHHIVAVHDPDSDLDGLGDGEMFLYVDGQLEGQAKKTQTMPIDYGDDDTTDAEFSIGTGRWCCHYNPFTGLVDEVAIFDHAFTQEEVTSAFENSFFVPSQPLLGDANNDEQVTGADLISVQQNFGNDYTNGACDGMGLGDANDDCLVTGGDLISVQQNFGKTAGTASVPEPMTAVLLLAMVTALRRQRSDVRLCSTIKTHGEDCG